MATSKKSDMLNADQKHHLLDRIREVASRLEVKMRDWPEPKELDKLRTRIAKMTKYKDQLVEKIDLLESELADLEEKHEDSSAPEIAKAKSRVAGMIVKAKEAVHFGNVESALEAVRELEKQHA